MQDQLFPTALRPNEVTILAYGALLSESSSRLTFPDLKRFRHVRVWGMRRVFAHPHLFLLQQQLVDPSVSLSLASLSAEPGSQHDSFVAAAFVVDLDDPQRAAFVQREWTYDIVEVPFHDLTVTDPTTTPPMGRGVICVASQDNRWKEDVAQLPKELPFPSIWHWPRTSGLRPANIYLRHCWLAVQKAGGTAEESFLQQTYLVDRETTLADYLVEHGEQVMASLPPPELAERFGG